jgi:tetratricopeptide (TPR) repeat protein
LAFNFLLKQMMFESEEQVMAYVNDVQLPCLLNLAACYLKLNYSYENVVIHCTDALKIKPDSAKALYRRAVAYAHLCEYELAGRDLIAAAKEEPNNEAIQQAWDDLKRRKQQYKDKLKRIAKVTFPSEEAHIPDTPSLPTAPPVKESWLESFKALVCRRRSSSKQ